MWVPRDKSRRLLGFARRMRHEPTEAERKLWRVLRSGRLQGWKFRRQHPVGGYILDFYCPRARLAVELDGGQHAEEPNAKYDEIRTQELARLGVRMARFWDYHMLKMPLVIAKEILRLCENPGAAPEPVEPRGDVPVRPSPQPSPGVPGEGEGGRSVPSSGTPGEG